MGEDRKNTTGMPAQSAPPGSFASVRKWRGCRKERRGRTARGSDGFERRRDFQKFGGQRIANGSFLCKSRGSLR